MRANRRLTEIWVRFGLLCSFGQIVWFRLLFTHPPLWVGGLVKYNFIAYFDFQSCQTLDWNKVSYWNKPVTFITFYIHSLGAGQLGQDERGLVGAKLSSPAVCLLT